MVLEVGEVSLVSSGAMCCRGELGCSGGRSEELVRLGVSGRGGEVEREAYACKILRFSLLESLLLGGSQKVS